MALQPTITPIDGSIYVERELANGTHIEALLMAASKAQRAWRDRPLSDRARLCGQLVDRIVAETDACAKELTWQIGRPIAQSPGELRGFAERARAMIEMAPQALADLDVGPKPGFRRFIRHEPWGLALALCPWNYPFLTSVNCVIPALMAGNVVLLKHSDQTPLCAERYTRAAHDVGFPDGVLQHIHCTHADVGALIEDPRVAFVSFTGSVAGGHAVATAAGRRFIGTGLELGGKDPAYVRSDADLKHAIENLVDGAFFNAGQSCCSIERIYVHRDVYEEFLEGFVELTQEYILGDPRNAETTLGPMVRTRAAEFVRAQIADAVAHGAHPLIDEKSFPRSEAGTPYLAPQVLVHVSHSMRLMREESFGPVAGIMNVVDDEQALRLMNDSHYGLTASIWTRDQRAAIELGDRLDTGTVFMNRCDYLDPALAWTGTKDSGRGCSLSRLGYQSLTRPKSFHLRG